MFFCYLHALKNLGCSGYLGMDDLYIIAWTGHYNEMVLFIFYYGNWLWLGSVPAKIFFTFLCYGFYF